MIKSVTPLNNALNVSNFNKGGFLIRLSNENQSVTKKLIVQ
jgi:hypothetical protein